MLYTQLKIDDYHIYKLRLNLLDVVQLERLFGESPLEMLQKTSQMSGIFNISIEKLVFILYASLQHNEINYSLNDAYDIFDDFTEHVGGIDTFLFVLMRLFTDMGFLGDDSEYYDEIVEEDTADEETIEDVVVEDITLETRFKRLLVKCLESGITEEFFWNSTYGEMLRYMKAFSARIQRERQDKAFFDYQLSNLIGISVSRLFGSTSMPEIHDVYPGIFKPPSEEELMKSEAMKLQARMEEYAAHHNAKKQLKEIEELYGVKLDNQ
jgi:hypothetical protein